MATNFAGKSLYLSILAALFTILVYPDAVSTEPDHNYYANFTSKKDLEDLYASSAPGRSHHGWELISTETYPVKTFWRACDSDVNGHHSELSTGWIPVNVAPSSLADDDVTKLGGAGFVSSSTVKPKLRLEYTTWCVDRETNRNCDGRKLSLKIESKYDATESAASVQEVFVPISSRYRMHSEEDYFRPQTSDLPVINGSLFRLSVYDDGLCIKISSIQIFSYMCKQEIVELATFPKTLAPFDQKSKEVPGRCVINAEDEQIKSGSLTPGSSRRCTPFGAWEDTFSLCKCLPGYQPNEQFTECLACPMDFYKQSYGNSRCLKCPQNSESSPGQNECRCRPMFFKESNEPASMNCASTPSMPRDLQARQISSTFVRLSWLPPWNDGGRAEIKYIIRCDECYPPREYATLTSNFTVNNLLPSARFTFRVYATNSVSRFFREISFSEISVHTTEQVIPSNLRFLSTRSDPNSIALTWDKPEQYAGSSYCVQMKSLLDSDQLPIIICVNGTSFIRSGLEEGQYSFRVAAQFADGSKGAYSATISATVSGSGHSMGQFELSQLVAVMAIVGTITLLILILCLGMACLYKKHNVAAATYEQQNNFNNCGTSSISPNAAATAAYPTGYSCYATLGKVPVGQAFVEPGWYEDPEMMFAEFVKEIPEKWLAVDSQIAALGDESLWSGKLLVPGHQPVEVSIKTVTHEFSPLGGLSQRKMAVEACIMAQFNHPNVLVLHGMTFSPTEWSMITECPLRLTLDKVLQSPGSNLSPLHLVHILRGVACGMRYLSDLGYIHKVLTSRTIYMGEHLVCKIGGFDLRALLEEETVAVSKISGQSEIHDFLMPWFAPEVIQSRNFSAASDVWSFGVLTWQTLNCGEAPYATCSTEEIADLVSKGQRLPAVPKGCPQLMASLLNDCTSYSRQSRPLFASIQSVLEGIIRQPHSLDLHSNSYPPTDISTPNSLARESSVQSTDSSCFNKMMRVNSNSSTCNYPPQPAALSDWLKKIGLHQYSEVFTRNGYLYLHELQGIDSDSLSQLGLNNPKHRKKLLGNLNSSLPTPPVPVPGPPPTDRCNKDRCDLALGTLERGDSKTSGGGGGNPAPNPVHSII